MSQKIKGSRRDQSCLKKSKKLLVQRQYLIKLVEHYWSTEVIKGIASEEMR